MKANIKSTISSIFLTAVLIAVVLTLGPKFFMALMVASQLVFVVAIAVAAFAYNEYISRKQQINKEK